MTTQASLSTGASVSKPLMRGATAVRETVVAYLSVVVPDVVAQAREQWDLDEFTLPVPVAYDAYEPYALDRWPLLGVNAASAGKFDRIGYDDGASPHYLTQYRVRVFTWVRTPRDEEGHPLEPEYSESIRLRDDLGACVRASLLRSGCLGRPDVVMFDESSLTEEYSDTTGVKGDRFVSGVVHAFSIRFDESVPLPPIGTAQTLTPTVDPLPHG